MPAETGLADIEIAALITYITKSVGNKQGLYDVDAAGKDMGNRIFQTIFYNTSEAVLILFQKNSIS